MANVTTAASCDPLIALIHDPEKAWNPIYAIARLFQSWHLFMSILCLVVLAVFCRRTYTKELATSFIRKYAAISIAGSGFVLTYSIRTSSFGAGPPACGEDNTWDINFPLVVSVILGGYSAFSKDIPSAYMPFGMAFGCAFIQR